MKNEAIERLHTNAGGIPGPSPDDPLPWLNSVPVVERLVRQYFHDLFTYLGQGKSVEGLPDFLLEKATYLNRMFLQFLPQMPEYGGYRTGPWNTPEQLGMFISKYLHIPGYTRQMVALALEQEAVPVLEKILSGKPEAQWQAATDRAVDRLVRGLTGIGDTGAYP